MDAAKRFETLEDELKLIKGELKQTLSSVRDYLLNMELPASEFATVLAALGDGADQKITMKGSFEAPKDIGLGEPPEAEEETPPEEPEEESLEPEAELEPEDESFLPESESELEPEDESFLPESESGLGPQDESFLPESESGLGPDESFLPESGSGLGPDESFLPESELAPEDEIIGQEEGLEPEPELFSEEEEPYEEEALMPQSELPTEEERYMEHDIIGAEASQSTPRVNLLANLIHWVAKAKKEIGTEQLPTFLEVYGVSGHLSTELKEAILNLIEITSEEPEDTNGAILWSHSMLALHGILTGGDAPLHPVRPFWGNGDGEIPADGPEPDEMEATEVDKPKDMPLKLKLVFPNGDGKGKEFCINLSPEVSDSDS